MHRKKTSISTFLVLGLLASPASAFGMLNAPVSLSDTDVVISIQAKASKKCEARFQKEVQKFDALRRAGKQEQADKAERKARRVLLSSACRKARAARGETAIDIKRMRSTCRQFAKANGHKFFSKSLNYQNRNTGKMEDCRDFLKGE